MRGGEKRGDAKATKLAYQQRRVVELWLERPKHQRTDDDLLKFFGWLSEHEPDLVPISTAGGAGTYQKLRALLREHIEEP